MMKRLNRWPFNTTSFHLCVIYSVLVVCLLVATARL